MPKGSPERRWDAQGSLRPAALSEGPACEAGSIRSGDDYVYLKIPTAGYLHSKSCVSIRDMFGRPYLNSGQESPVSPFSFANG